MKSEWQPIETAPKDGTWVLVFSVSFGVLPCAARWEQSIEGWVNVEDEIRLRDADSLEEDDKTADRCREWPLTHWMPLPEPPEDG